MRKTAIFTAIGAMVLVAGAATVRWGVLPEVRQLPSNLDTTLHLSGTADLLDATALQSGSLATAVQSNVPVTLQERTRVTSTHGRTAVVSDESTLRGPTGTLQTLTHIWAVDRVTLAAATPPAGSNALVHDGLVIGFPLSPAPHSYPYWDSTTRTSTTAQYQKTETHGQRRTYVYQVHATGPVKDPAVASSLPAALPKTALVGMAASMSPTIQQTLAAMAGSLPDQLPLTYTATTDTTVWVDTATGYVIDFAEKQAIVAGITGAPPLPLPSAFSMSVRFTPDSVTAERDAAAKAESGLATIGTVAPLVLLGLGVLLALIAIWLGSRRRGTGGGGSVPHTG